MPTVEESLAQAITYHRAGQLTAAAALYRQILQAAPTLPDAWHYLGLIHHQQGQSAEALKLLLHARQLRPNWPALWSNLAEVYRALNQWPQAIAAARQALQLEPNFPDACNNLGIALRLSGQLDEAAVWFRRALELNPQLGMVHNNLAGLLKQQGRLTEAGDHARRAAQLVPHDAEVHNTLAAIYVELRLWPEAYAAVTRALELNPDLVDAHHTLGDYYREQEDWDRAEACYRHCLSLKARQATVLNNLGLVRHGQQQFDEAMQFYLQALQVDPELPAALNNVGTALFGRGELDAARRYFEHLVRLNPQDSQALNNLGLIDLDQGRPELAEQAIRRALACDPLLPQAHNNLGSALHWQAREVEAARCYLRALELQPDMHEARVNLSGCYVEQGLFSQALAEIEHALADNNQLPAAYQNQGVVLRDLARHDEAIAANRRGLEIEPTHAHLFSNLLLSLQYHPRITPEWLRQEHEEFDRRLAAPLADDLRTPANDAPADRAHAATAEQRDPERRLRVGLVSGDFFSHPVGRFLIPIVEQLDHASCELTLYCDRYRLDAYSERFRQAADRWVTIVGWTDAQLAGKIAADRIDIVIELAGHTAGNRLLALARRPAPVQMSWIGYVGTTGLKAIDYVVADRWQVPPEEEPHYVERVLRFPHGYVCYDPPADAPQVQPLPALNSRYFTLASFNNPAKVTQPVLQLWAQVLQRIPPARLWLQYRGWSDPAQLQRIAEVMGQYGIGPDRYQAQGSIPHDQLMARYLEVDLALDPFPYSGGLTTCEALWMGVPVVTWPGRTFASRHSLSHLSNVGLTETIAQSPEEYVNIVCRLAGDLPHLAQVRSGLREQMRQSPLCNGAEMARDWLELMRTAWRNYCQAGS